MLSTSIIFLFGALIGYCIYLIKSGKRKEEISIKRELNDTDYFNLAQETHNKGEYLKAIEYYTKAIELNSNAYYYAARAQSYFLVPDFVNANIDINKATELKADEPSFYLIRAEFFIKYKLTKRAIKNLEVAAKLGSKKAQADLNRFLSFKLAWLPKQPKIDHSIYINAFEFSDQNNVTPNIDYNYNFCQDIMYSNGSGYTFYLN